MILRRALAVLASLALFAGPLPARAATHDDLVIGIGEFPSSLHPSIDPLLIKSTVLGFSLRLLTTYDSKGTLVCLLCTQVPTIENGLAKVETRPDGSKGMAVTIKLRPELKWGDGVPITAKDLAFTWKVGSDPNSGFSNANPWTRASGVDVVDDHTAVLHLKTVLTSYNLWDQILPEHIEGPVYDAAKNAGDYIKATVYNRDPTTPGLWDGPYLLSGYQSGSQIVMTANPNWTGTKPGFKRVVLRFIGNTAALQANLLSGDIDLDNNLTIDQVLELRRQHPDQFTYTFSKSLTYGHLDVQRDNPVLKDVRVRRALLMTIDRATINKKLFDGLQPLATSFVSPNNPFFDPQIPAVAFDPAGAKKLLTEAGFTPGQDGICRDPQGQRLSFELLTATGFQVVDLMAQVLQSTWKTNCIEATLRSEPSRTLFGQTTKHRAFTGLVYYTWTSSVGESPLRTLGTESIPTAANNWGGANFTAFSDRQFDADGVIADTDLDVAKQKAAWWDMQTIYADQLPALPMFISLVPQALPKWLLGFEATPTGQPDVQHCENWHPG